MFLDLLSNEGLFVKILVNIECSNRWEHEMWMIKHEIIIYWEHQWNWCEYNTWFVMIE